MDSYTTPILLQCETLLAGDITRIVLDLCRSHNLCRSPYIEGTEVTMEGTYILGPSPGITPL